MKPQGLPRAADKAFEMLDEVGLEFRSPGRPEDAPDVPDLPEMPELPGMARLPEAPALPDLELPEVAATDIEIPFAQLPDIFDL